MGVRALKGVQQQQLAANHCQAGRLVTLSPLVAPPHSNSSPHPNAAARPARGKRPGHLLLLLPLLLLLVRGSWLGTQHHSNTSTTTTTTSSSTSITTTCHPLVPPHLQSLLAAAPSAAAAWAAHLCASHSRDAQQQQRVPHLGVHHQQHEVQGQVVHIGRQQHNMLLLLLLLPALSLLLAVLGWFSRQWGSRLVRLVGCR